jgi:hypothetical protein
MAWRFYDAVLAGLFAGAAGWLVHDTANVLSVLRDEENVVEKDATSTGVSALDRAWYRPATPPFPQLGPEEPPDAGYVKPPFISLKVTLKSVVYRVDEPWLSTAGLVADRDEDMIFIVSLGDCDPARPTWPCNVIEEDWLVTQIGKREVTIMHVPSGESIPYRLDDSFFNDYPVDAGAPALPPRAYWYWARGAGWHGHP